MTGYRPAQVIEAIGRHLRAYEKDRTIGTRKGIRFFTGSPAKKISRQTDAEKQCPNRRISCNERGGMDTSHSDLSFRYLVSK